MKRLLIILGIILVAVLALGGLAKKQGWIGEEKLRKVAIKEAKPREIIGVVSASGKIYPEIEVKISPDVPGEIIELYVEEGDSVKQGQLLLKIRPDDFNTAIDRSISGLENTKAAKANAEARLEQAKAALANASGELDRAKRLFAEELISEQDLNQRQLQFNNAQADVRAAEQNVRAAEFTIRGAATDVRSARENYIKTVIRAPNSGIISELNVEKGERVVGTSQMAGTEMLTIANLKDMECRIEVSENDIAKVNLGDSCRIEVDAYYGKVFYGKVTQISNSQANNATQSISADQVTNYEVTVNIAPESYLDLKDKRFPFRPGMSAEVDIITETVNDQITVPIQAVTPRTDEDIHEMSKDTMSFEAKKNLDESDLRFDKERKEYVFVVNNGKTEIRKVSSGIQDDEYIVITDGLNVGDSVIFKPYEAIVNKLKLGEEVEIVKEGEVYESRK